MLRECKSDLTDEQVQALGYQCVMDDTDSEWEECLKKEERVHLEALESAFRTLMEEEVLELRIRKVIGAALTCGIEAPKIFGEGVGLNLALISFPRVEGNKILTECLKAYREFDGQIYWDINAFEAHESVFSSIEEGWNLLACCAMIDEQAEQWVKKAKKHLDKLELGQVKGLLLNENDILSRAALMKGTEFPEGDVPDYVKATTSTFHWAVNNDDMEPMNVGFATVGGKALADLAPMMFATAQKIKKGHWHLTGNEHNSVWFALGETILACNLFMRNDARDHLKALDQRVPDFELMEYHHMQKVTEYRRLKLAGKRKRRMYYHWHGDIPPADEEGEVY